MRRKNLLTITSKREQESQREEQGYVIRERRGGAFKRSFVPPQDADAEQITARFRDGLLTVTVPKLDQSHRLLASESTVSEDAPG